MILPSQQENQRGSPEPERRLVETAQKRPEEFVALYDRYAKPVFRYLCSRVGSFEEAEDLTSVTFLEALEALPRYRERGAFAAWLFSIARRKAADHYRRHPAPSLEEAGDPADPRDVQGEVARRDELARLKRVLDELPEEEREWIRLHFTAGLTFREMAPLIGKSEDAAKKAVYRLLAKLQSRME